MKGKQGGLRRGSYASRERKRVTKQRQNKPARATILWQPLDGEEQVAQVSMRWAEPVDPGSELVDSAIALIGPSKDKEAACRKHIALTIRLIRMLWPNDKAPKKLLDQLRQTSLKMSNLIGKLSMQSRSDLLSDWLDEPNSKTVKTQGLTVHIPTGPSRMDRLRAELDSLAAGITSFHSKKSRGPSTDFVKLMMAQSAYEFLDQFASTKPGPGAFFDLASFFYESATGVVNVSMERQCRNFLKQKKAMIDAGLPYLHSVMNVPTN